MHNTYKDMSHSPSKKVTQSASPIFSSIQRHYDSVFIMGIFWIFMQ